MMLRQIQHFQTIVQENSFTKAAELCHISQSGISQSIKALEDEIGAKLLKRKNRAFELTEAGEHFYKKSLIITADLEQLCRETVRIDRKDAAELSLGVLSTYSGDEFNRTIAAFSEKYPAVELTVTSGIHEDLYDGMRFGRIDIVLNDQRRAFSDTYENLVLMETACYVELASHNPLAKLDVVDVEALKNTPCILVASKEQQEEPVPDPIKPETDRFAIETREGAPVIHSDNMADVAEATLTQDDFDEGYSLLLVSSLFGEGGVPEGDRIALSDKAKELGAAEGVWFDVSLYKVQGENVTKLDAVPTLVNITAQVPESLRKDGRTFYLLYAHNGKATNAADGAGDTLAWKTDVFSTYLLAYKDKESPNPDKAADDTEKADTKASKAATKSSSSPAKTGDKLQMMVIALAATTIAAGAVAIAIALRRKRED